MAALEAARCGARVLLFDTNGMVGRKLLVTGNGRCNISNAQAAPRRYTCADPPFLEVAFAHIGHGETVSRLHELGILTYVTPDGWCYPLSDSAATVAETFAASLELAGVGVHLKTKIADLRVSGGRVTLVSADPSQTYSVDRAIIATGGKAYPALGSKGDFFPVLQRLGHRIAPIYPALAPITADVKQFHKLQGVRLDVGLTLSQEGRILGRSIGNMMFTQFGFSGPAAMHLSHIISTRPAVSLSLSMDLLPHYRGELVEIVSRMRRRPVPLRVVLGSVLPPKIPLVVLPMADISADARMTDLEDSDLDRLLSLLGHLTVQIRGTRGFQFAQLSTGGVLVQEVDPSTMGSRLVPGLHFAGEVMDVVGPCGGYNLQFAFTSGMLAGRGAASG